MNRKFSYHLKQSWNQHHVVNSFFYDTSKRERSNDTIHNTSLDYISGDSDTNAKREELLNSEDSIVNSVSDANSEHFDSDNSSENSVFEYSTNNLDVRDNTEKSAIGETWKNLDFENSYENSDQDRESSDRDDNTENFQMLSDNSCADLDSDDNREHFGLDDSREDTNADSIPDIGSPPRLYSSDSDCSATTAGGVVGGYRNQQVRIPFLPQINGRKGVSQGAIKTKGRQNNTNFDHYSVVGRLQDSLEYGHVSHSYQHKNFETSYGLKRQNYVASNSSTTATEGYKYGKRVSNTPLLPPIAGRKNTGQRISFRQAQSVNSRSSDVEISTFPIPKFPMPNTGYSLSPIQTSFRPHNAQSQFGQHAQYHKRPMLKRIKKKKIVTMELYEETEEQIYDSQWNN